MKAPADLGDWHRRKLFQLELDHRESFIEITPGQLNDSQENILRRKPGDV
jgi:hypothetical protein